jgi:uncharacterized protein YkwD
MRTFAAIVMLVALPACGGSSTGAGGGVVSQPPPRAAPPAPENNSFATLLNNVRVANSATPVTYDARLGRAAQGHAVDLVTNNSFSHTGTNGSTIGDRARAQGYNYTLIGENIARGQQNVQSVMTDWTNSTTGHHENNIDPRFEDFGLGVTGTGGNRTWVLVLGAE